ncbi:MAG: four helix bundle protein [bacterium]
MAFRFEGLDIFQQAIQFAEVVYRLSKAFPREEVFGLTANLRRAATSIGLNIAEGSGRGTRKDFAHYIDVAHGSLCETFASFLLAERLGYVSATQVAELREQADHLARRLANFKKSLSGDRR